MKLGLIFTPDARIYGEGIDDVARFTVDGFFNAATSQAAWRKAYVGMHSVDYSGFYDQRTICGNWTLANTTGGFWIWPDALAEKDAMGEEIEEPVELVAPAIRES